MRRTASEVLRDLEIRIAHLERQARLDDESVMLIAKTLNEILQRKGLHTDLVAEPGIGVGILVEDSLGDAMEKLVERTFGIKWVDDESFMINGLLWRISRDREGDISLDADY
jgi:hypothetical protein